VQRTFVPNERCRASHLIKCGSLDAVYKTEEISKTETTRNEKDRDGTQAEGVDYFMAEKDKLPKSFSSCGTSSPEFIRWYAVEGGRGQ